MADQIESKKSTSLLENTESPASSSHIAITFWSLAFSILQGMCTAVVAINGVRLAIGLGSLAMSTGLGAAFVRFHHVTWLRITFLIGALGGSILVLAIAFNARRLRNRPAARWRQRPRTPHERRMEALQITISIVTLIMVAIEEYLHFQLLHTL